MALPTPTRVCFADTRMKKPPARHARPRALPAVCYPETLPITAHRDAIVAACRDNQVVIVAGETGSGKTTQLPKMLVELGCGARGMVGCTQPRRIAATSVAARVAEELGPGARRQVGYQVRFDNKTSRDTVIKFMTDGILLTETQTDRQLKRYNALIIDEAHERSLNIDFLLGYLKRLLPHRPDLKLVVSSATLDVDRFAAFFNDAPILEVPGRTYPVDLLHRPPTEDDSDVTADVADTVGELTTLEPRADILVFLPGEREIRETARVIEGRGHADTDVIPLYSRLPAKQQRRAFQVGTRRRIILATNVAETSVTLPGIRAVIDPGQARVKRYNPRTQVEKLHIEAISQASANQRKGRCGRVGPGICIRLYDEDDFRQRDAYTDPEIKRSSLASVILTMLHLDLGHVERFPFLDPPTPTAIKDGYRELRELGAIDDHRRLTRMGRTLCRFSLEPRLGRMLVEGHRRRVLSDVVTVVAALSTDDPRLRPPDERDAADGAHAAFAAETSDFSSRLRLWRHIQSVRASRGSQRQFRTHCRTHYLSYRRIREWEAVREQLVDECRQAKFAPESGPANEEFLHRCLLPGLLNKIGLRRERGGYRGARGMVYTIHPGSVLSSKQPEWVVAAELVETSRLFGRTVGIVTPGWIEEAGQHLCRHHYGPPYWDARTGFVRAEESVSLYGIPLAQGRKRHFGPIDPVASREVFVQQALVEGQLRSPPPVIRRNAAAIQRIEDLEAKIRRRNILTTDADIAAFYDQRLPPDVYSARALAQWLREDARAESLLTLTDDDLTLREPDDITPDRYPDRLPYGDHELPLEYAFRRGEPEDGITCRVPLAALQDLPAAPFDWLVPGFLAEKVHHILKALPKRYRREFVPLDRTVSRIMDDLRDRDGPLLDALQAWILKQYSLRLPPDAWPTELPPHLTMQFVVIDDDGTELARGRDLDTLKRQVGARVEAATPARTETQWNRGGIVEWDFGDLPGEVDLGSEAWRVIQYPGLVDEGDSVSLALFDSRHAADRATALGLACLAALALPRDVKQLRKLPELPPTALLALRALVPQDTPIQAQILRRTICNACHFADDPPHSNDAFVERIYAGKSGFYPEAMRLCELVGQMLETAGGLLSRIEYLDSVDAATARNDMRNQLTRLFAADFVLRTPSVYIEQFPRYLRAVNIRLGRRSTRAERDAERQVELAPYLARVSDWTAPPTEAEETYRWMLEEWRVSLFAQELGTRVPVSAKRLDKQWARVQSSG